MIDDKDCMLWAGALTGNGYAYVGIKKNGKYTTAVLHRQLYLVQVGDIEEGLVLDHLCRNRCCINTDHLEPVTNQENIRRGIWESKSRTHCLKGHNIYEVGFYQTSRTTKLCKVCSRERNKEYYRKSKELLTPQPVKTGSPIEAQ